MNKPEFKTAIPKRRYQYGDFQVTLLADIESATDDNYRFIMAVMTDTDPEPGMYLILEPQREGGGDQLRLLMHDGEQVIARDLPMQTLDQFSEQALVIVGKVLGIEGMEPFLIS